MKFGANSGRYSSQVAAFLRAFGLQFSLTENGIFTQLNADSRHDGTMINNNKMKTLYGFAYCQDQVLTRDVIFYTVKVGVSEKDKKAWRYVVKATQGFCWIQRYDNAALSFIEKCAVSLFPNRSKRAAVAMLRRKQVDVTWLATFLRHTPATLLNSLRIPTGRPLL